MPIAFNLPEAAYTPLGISYLKSATEREARREYSRLRSIARKRVERLAASKDFSRSYLARRTWKPLSEITDIRDVERGLAELKHFLQSATTLREARQTRENKIAERLISRNFRVAASNLKDFGEFMEWARSTVIGLLVSSDEAADLYEAAKVRGVRTKDLERDFVAWLSKREELEMIDPNEGLSSTEIRRRLGIK